MKRYIAFVLLVVVILSSFVVPVFAATEGLVSFDSVDDTVSSGTVSVSLEDVNNNLIVIQSQLWIILIVGILYFAYRFLRLFF